MTPIQSRPNTRTRWSIHVWRSTRTLTISRDLKLSKQVARKVIRTGIMEFTYRRLPRVTAMTGVGGNWSYAEMARGWFPVPLNLRRRAVGRRDSHVAGWPASCKVRRA